MLNISPVEQISNLFQVIGPAARLQILLAIGEGEVCVCHLEAMLGLRQAALSQHLMALREAGIVSDRREGLPLPDLAPSPVCECPNCSSQRDAGCR
jgi:DNA-binding transcriptional ArsR family regulator